MTDPYQEIEDRELPEWARTTERIDLSAKALATIGDLIANPPRPSERLRAAAKGHWQRLCR